MLRQMERTRMTGRETSGQHQGVAVIDTIPVTLAEEYLRNLDPIFSNSTNKFWKIQGHSAH